HRWRRALFDQLLVTALNAAFAFAEVHQAAVLVTQDLDLDMARPSDVALEEDAVIAETGHSFALGGREVLVELLGGFYDPHAAAAAARARPDQDTEADASRAIAQRATPLDRAVIARECGPA